MNENFVSAVIVAAGSSRRMGGVNKLLLRIKGREVLSRTVEAFEKNTGLFPKVIFLENHGLVTTADTAEECTALHIEINEKIKNHLGLSDFSNDLELSENGDTFTSNAKVIGEFVSRYGEEEVSNTILYPDQLVYLNGGLDEGKISFEDAAKKLDTW